MSMIGILLNWSDRLNVLLSDPTTVKVNNTIVTYRWRYVNNLGKISICEHNPRYYVSIVYDMVLYADYDYSQEVLRDIHSQLIRSENEFR